MAVQLHSFNNSDGNLWEKSKQALSDSTNIHLNDCSISSKYSHEKSTTTNKADRFVDNSNQRDQRAMYNARQTLLIPFITDIDFSSLVNPSELESHFLINILTLLKTSNEECSFFEQFKI